MKSHMKRKEKQVLKTSEKIGLYPLYCDCQKQHASECSGEKLQLSFLPVGFMEWNSRETFYTQEH